MQARNTCGPASAGCISLPRRRFAAIRLPVSFPACPNLYSRLQCMLTHINVKVDSRSHAVISRNTNIKISPFA
jgi:pSer/pThr/pTyr-binding forkhead associated (FHA) protein